MNVVLCGMMGCGKSTVGKVLAERLGARFVDVDEVIVARYGNISNLFERYGEEYFRELETKIIEELSKQEGLVIATGGGAALKAQNVALLKRNGRLVYLRARVETLGERLQTDTQRPLLRNAENLRQRLETLLNARAPVYERAADITVDVDEKTPEEIAKEIGQV